MPVYDLKYVEKNMAYIPAGTFTIGYPWDTTKCKNVTVEAFYMFNQEIPNRLYCYYLNELRKAGDLGAYGKALPDITVWRKPRGHMEPYVEYYFLHPAYADYPLVGISYQQSLEFCQWLTGVYNKWPNRKFKKVMFDLPDSIQWEYAARGGQEFSLFPWKGYTMQNEKGYWMANFRPMAQAGIMRMEFEKISMHGEEYMETYYVASGGGEHMGVAGRLSDEAGITAPVYSYRPNAYGVYNMAGNVEEFIHPEGYTKGGSWRDPGYYLLNRVTEKYDVTRQPSAERGFRFIMKVMEQ